MRIEDIDFDPILVLERLAVIYGFHQKIQLANHFDMSASSLSNRYTRGNISYDLVALCSLETGANVKWLLTGEGPKFPEDNTQLNSNNGISVNKEISYYVLCDGSIRKEGSLSTPPYLQDKNINDPMCITIDNSTFFIDKSSPLSDGVWLIDIDGAVSIRTLTVLPGKRLHVSGGSIPFECGVNEVVKIGKVIGKFSELV